MKNLLLTFVLYSMYSGVVIAPDTFYPKFRYDFTKVNHFEQWYKFIKHTEGGYANRPMVEDPGGETNKGITLKTYINYCKEHKFKYKYKNFRNLSDKQVKQIAYTAFWKPIGNKLGNTPLTLLLAYSFWGGGGYELVKDMQRILNLTVDGILGEQTILAANEAGPELFEKLVRCRTKYLRSCKNYRYNPGWEKAITFLENYNKNTK